jgi:hypothetical protein
MTVRLDISFVFWSFKIMPPNLSEFALGGYFRTYRVIQEVSAIPWEMIVCVILSKKFQMNMGPILNGYRDNITTNIT